MSRLILEKIKQQKVVPLFYNDSYETSKSIVTALYDAGIRVIEYTNRGKQALSNFTKLKASSEIEFPGLLLGVGTIKNKEEMEDYIAANADFIITPVIDEDLIAHSQENNILIIPGCFTPSDINIAFQKGLKMVKIFPADAVGKPYIQSVQSIFPDMHFMPTGGIMAEIEDIKEWLNGGAAAVGLGSSLIKKDIPVNLLKEKVQELLINLNSL